jgi:hypothetical protein
MPLLAVVRRRWILVLDPSPALGWPAFLALESVGGAPAALVFILNSRLNPALK